MPTKKIFIELGDIIKINAPSNTDVHDKIFFVKYLDNNKLELIHDETLLEHILSLQDGNIRDESINSISILSKAEKKGYALQNNLLPKTWIDIYFNGDIPITLTGQINNLENDMIEITTYPENKKIYIDFEYKGLPKKIRVQKIIIRSEPKSILSLKETDEEEETSASKEILDETKEKIKEILLSEDDIVFGEDIGEMSQFIDVPDEEKRYSLIAQTNDLLDELLSENIHKSSKNLTKIHKIVQRYKQLRILYSSFDTYGNIQKILKISDSHKPVIDELFHFSKNIPWLVPISQNIKKIYDVDIEHEDEEDIQLSKLMNVLSEMTNIMDEYKQNNIPDSQNKYTFLISKLNSFLTPFSEPLIKNNTIITKTVNNNILTIVNNLNDIFSSVSSGKDDPVIKQKRFNQQVYLKELTKLKIDSIRTDKIKIQFEPMTNKDILTLRGFLQLPWYVFQYSYKNSPTTSLINKVHYNLSNFTYSNILKKNTYITPIAIKSIENPLKFSKTSFFNNIKEIYNDNLDLDDYYKFLQTIIPNKNEIFELIQHNFIKHTSYEQIVHYLSPFMIFENDINLSIHKQILHFLKTNIDAFLKTYHTSIKSLNQYNNFTFKRIFQESNLLLLDEVEPYNTNHIYSSEILKDILTIDNGRFFYN